MVLFFYFHPGAGWALFVWVIVLGVVALQQCGEKHHRPSLLFYETQK